MSVVFSENLVFFVFPEDSMLVNKTINNNIVSCLDDSGQELIVMGRGLGFQCKPGTPLRTDLVEKVFHLEDPQQVSRFKSLVRNLPPTYLQLCTRIIDYAAEVLNTRLQECIYLTLTDHVCFAIQRQQQGLSFHNSLEYEVRTFYPREYAIGRHALTMIRDELNVTLPDDEAASIALHLINAERDVSLQDTLRSTQTLHDTLDLLAHFPQLKLQPGNPYYDELAVLLKFLVQRSFSDPVPTESDPVLIDMIRQQCPKSFEIAQCIVQHLEETCGHSLPEEEAACLAIHIRRILNLTNT